MDQRTTERPDAVPPGDIGAGGDDYLRAGFQVPRRKAPKWPWFLGAFLLLLGITANWLANLQIDYYALSPGPVNDVGDFVSVPGQPEHVEEGELFFLTVSLKEITALEYVAGWLDPEVTLTKRETIRAPGVSQEELTRQNLALMDGSKRNATFVALTRLGYEPELIGSGAHILGTLEGTAAHAVLQENDVIVEVDGKPIEFANDAVDSLAGKTPGTVIHLVIERPGDDGTSQRLEFDLTLGPFLGVDENDEPVVDESRGMVGVLLDDANPQEIFPVEVDIDTQNIGGPSAGMMFTLELINQLTDDDITKGHRIAGTGSIDRDGNVGSIGGVRQKVFGAIHARAEYVLVPASNYDDAIEAAGDDITVVRIETIDDALAFLAGL